MIKVIPEGDDPADLLKPVAQPARPPSQPRTARRTPRSVDRRHRDRARCCDRRPRASSSPGVEPLAGNGVQLLDATSHAIAATLSIHGSPGGIASGAGSSGSRTPKPGPS